jgi:hypothetical protein
MPALVMSLLLVVGAVLFGIYGPTVAGRLSHGGGLPLADVLDAAARLRYRAIMDSLENAGEADLAPEEAKGLLQRLTGRPVVAPDLASIGFHLMRVGPVSLPGSTYRSAVLVYQGRGQANERWVLLFVAADEGQYLAFAARGRPRPLSADQTLEGELPGMESTALVWSDGEVLRLACFENTADADAARAPLGAP